MSSLEVERAAVQQRAGLSKRGGTPSDDCRRDQGEDATR